MPVQFNGKNTLQQATLPDFLRLFLETLVTGRFLYLSAYNRCWLKVI